MSAIKIMPPPKPKIAVRVEVAKAMAASTRSFNIGVFRQLEGGELYRDVGLRALLSVSKGFILIHMNNQFLNFQLQAVTLRRRARVMPVGEREDLAD
jgi:hypothetical protein